MAFSLMCMINIIINSIYLTKCMTFLGIEILFFIFLSLRMCVCKNRLLFYSNELMSETKKLKVAISPHVRWFVAGLLVTRSVCHIFLKGRQVEIPCSYRSTSLSYVVFHILRCCLHSASVLGGDQCWVKATRSWR